MPYQRPTLSNLQQQIAEDIQTNLQGSDPLVRFAVLTILGKALARIANLHYGYLDWIALQAVPYTATGEFLEAWGALKNVFRDPAEQASDGVISFPCSGTKTIPLGASITRSDGTKYTVTAAATGTGTINVSAQANADPTGLTGAFGNCAIGTQMTLDSAISGVTSTGTVTTAFTDGSDQQSDDSFRTVVMEAYQTTPGIATPTQYQEWADEVPGVTRSWCLRNAMGSGTVGIYFMMDVTESAHGGFPQGTNGVATAEDRDTAATGDQLTVANYVFNLQPAGPIVYSMAPAAQTINFVLTGWSGWSGTTQAAVTAALQDVVLRNGSPLGTWGSANSTVIDKSDLEAAVESVPGTTGFVMTSPSANIACVVGQLPTVGTIGD